MSKKEENKNKLNEYAEKFGTVLAVGTNGGISVDRETYKGIVGEEVYQELAKANETQLLIDGGIALAATKVGYAHIQANSDVNSVQADIKQYEGRSLSGTINRSTRIPGRDGATDGSKPGGTRWAVNVTIKGSEFKKQTQVLAESFFGK